MASPQFRNRRPVSIHLPDTYTFENRMDSPLCAHVMGLCLQQRACLSLDCEGQQSEQKKAGSFRGDTKANDMRIF